MRDPITGLPLDRVGPSEEAFPQSLLTVEQLQALRSFPHCSKCGEAIRVQQQESRISAVSAGGFSALKI